MKAWKLWTSLAAAAVVGCQQGGSGASASSRTLETQRDKVSYAIGLDIGKSFKQQSISAEEVDLGKLRAGIEDVLGDAKPVLNDSQVGEVMMAFQTRMMAKQDSLNRARGEANQKAGDEFLAKNAKEEGVVTLPSGLQYKVIAEGKGKKPKADDNVTVHYTGTLMDGTEFDSSVKRGQPATFPVTGVIPGWTEALQLMPEGSKWKLFVPPALGYGARGAGNAIGPNAVLIFDIELISSAHGSGKGHEGHGHP
jgi:FKBP-type peptidyl-prolyl cis-trans isomerase FklB